MNGYQSLFIKIVKTIASIFPPIIAFLLTAFMIQHSGQVRFGAFVGLSNFAKFIAPTAFILAGAIFCLRLDKSYKHIVSKVMNCLMCIIWVIVIALLFIYRYAEPFNDVLVIELYSLFISVVMAVCFFKSDEDVKGNK